MSDQPTGKTPKDTHYAKLRRAHRDAKRPGGESPPMRRGPAQPGKPVPAGLVRLYGLHTVAAALKNPQRRLKRLFVTRNAKARLEISDSAIPCPIEMVDPRDLDNELGMDAVHQGAMLETEPLPVKSLAALGESRLLLVLDQVTDPHNVGAILRSATAFAAGAVVTTERHSPQESGVLAKSASGALEAIPYIQVTNLANAIEELSSLGFLTIGLDSEGPEPFEDTLQGERIAIVLGAEGKGLRQKTRQIVESLARLDMPGTIHSLNVSNAAAVALYASDRYLKRR